MRKGILTPKGGCDAENHERPSVAGVPRRVDEVAKINIFIWPMYLTATLISSAD